MVSASLSSYINLKLRDKRHPQKKVDVVELLVLYLPCYTSTIRKRHVNGATRKHFNNEGARVLVSLWKVATNQEKFKTTTIRLNMSNQKVAILYYKQKQVTVRIIV